jgi:hypothetical protein
MKKKVREITAFGNKIDVWVECRYEFDRKAEAWTIVGDFERNCFYVRKKLEYDVKELTGEDLSEWITNCYEKQLYEKKKREVEELVISKVVEEHGDITIKTRP